MEAGLRRVLDPDRAPRSPGEVLDRTGAGHRLRVADGALDADRAAALVPELARLVAEHPARERLRAVHLPALHAAGRPAAASRAPGWPWLPAAGPDGRTEDHSAGWRGLDVTWRRPVPPRGLDRP